MFNNIINKNNKIKPINEREIDNLFIQNDNKENHNESKDEKEIKEDKEVKEVKEAKDEDNNQENKRYFEIHSRMDLKEFDKKLSDGYDNIHNFELKYKKSKVQTYIFDYIIFAYNFYNPIFTMYITLLTYQQTDYSKSSFKSFILLYSLVYPLVTMFTLLNTSYYLYSKIFLYYKFLDSGIIFKWDKYKIYHMFYFWWYIVSLVFVFTGLNNSWNTIVIFLNQTSNLFIYVYNSLNIESTLITINNFFEEDIKYQIKNINNIKWISEKRIENNINALLESRNIIKNKIDNLIMIIKNKKDFENNCDKDRDKDKEENKENNVVDNTNKILCPKPKPKILIKVNDKDINFSQSTPPPLPSPSPSLSPKNTTDMTKVETSDSDSEDKNCDKDGKCTQKNKEYKTSKKLIYYYDILNKTYSNYIIKYKDNKDNKDKEEYYNCLSMISAQPNIRFKIKKNKEKNKSCFYEYCYYINYIYMLIKKKLNKEWTLKLLNEINNTEGWNYPCIFCSCNNINESYFKCLNCNGIYCNNCKIQEKRYDCYESDDRIHSFILIKDKKDINLVSTFDTNNIPFFQQMSNISVLSNKHIIFYMDLIYYISILVILSVEIYGFYYIINYKL